MLRPATARAPERRRAAGPRRSAWIVAGLALLGACRAAGGERSGPGPGAPPAPPASLFTLRAAIDAGDDVLAEAMIARLRQYRLTTSQEQMLDASERVLAGRTLVRLLDFSLESEPVGDLEGRYRLLLRARSRASAPLKLGLPPSDLKSVRSSIDARGVEGLDYESRACSVLSDLELAPGVERRIELTTYELPLGRALAARERWQLGTRSGELWLRGEAFPATGVRVEGCVTERLSPLLSSEASTPAELLALLEAQPAPEERALLETALRLDGEQREQALAELAAPIARLALAEPERVLAAEPALRWMSGNREIGLDPLGWARYLSARAQRAASAAEDRPGPDLDLPDRLDLPRRPASAAPRTQDLQAPQGR